MSEVPEPIRQMARDARRVVVITGSGMSAESGLATFHDVQTGLWAKHGPDDLASQEAWQRDPDFVWAWYRWRIAIVRRVEPNAGHLALAAWAEQDDAEVWVVTQNVDDLHERAGSSVLAHLHGSIFALRGSQRVRRRGGGHAAAVRRPVERLAPSSCEVCGGTWRPCIVWFGESLQDDAFAHAEAAIDAADLVLVVGTSGLVFPAANLPFHVLKLGIPVVALNPQGTDFSDAATCLWRETAANALPALVVAARG